MSRKYLKIHDAFIRVIGTRPKYRPYVWIGRDGEYLASIDPRQMNALVRRWQKANRK